VPLMSVCERPSSCNWSFRKHDRGIVPLMGDLSTPKTCTASLASAQSSGGMVPEMADSSRRSSLRTSRPLNAGMIVPDIRECPSESTRSFVRCTKWMGIVPERPSELARSSSSIIDS